MNEAKSESLVPEVRYMVADKPGFGDAAFQPLSGFVATDHNEIEIRAEDLGIGNHAFGVSPCALKHLSSQMPGSRRYGTPFNQLYQL